MTSENKKEFDENIESNETEDVQVDSAEAAEEDVFEAEIVDEEDQEENLEENSEMVSSEEYDSLKDSFVRLQADFTNYKRRSESERSEYLELGSKKVLTDLLSVIDNFERALEQESSDEKFAEGVEMIYRQILELLNKFDVVELEALGADFDPNLHHAVMVEEREGVKADIVIEVLQKGYMMGDKLLRPAMVKVSK